MFELVTPSLRGFSLVESGGFTLVEMDTQEPAFPARDSLRDGDPVDEAVAAILAALREDQSAISQRILQALDDAATWAGDEASQAAEVLRVLLEHRPDLERMLAASGLAGALEGMRRLVERPGGPEATAAAAVASASNLTTPPANVTTPAGAATPNLLPLVEEAVAHLSRVGVLSPEQLASMVAAHQEAARPVAENALRDAHEAINRHLIESVKSGGTLNQFRDGVRKTLTEVPSSFLSDANLETRFRTGVMNAYSQGQMALVQSNPFARQLFPYASYHATHDDRVREEHLHMEEAGLDGTNVFRSDDPVFLKYMPPSFFNCRCVWNPLTIESAAAAGVKEAQEWLRTGIAPAYPARVPEPKNPPKTFASAGFTLATPSGWGFELAWERDPNYRGSVGKWIGTGEHAGQKPRYQAKQPGLGRGRQQPGGAAPPRTAKDIAAGKKPVAKKPAGEKKPPAPKKPGKRELAAADYQKRAENAKNLLERIGKGEVDAGADWARNAVRDAMSRATVAQLMELGKEAGIKLPRLKSKAVEVLTDHALKTAGEKAAGVSEKAADEKPAQTPEDVLKGLYAKGTDQEAGDYLDSLTDGQIQDAYLSLLRPGDVGREKELIAAGVHDGDYMKHALRGDWQFGRAEMQKAEQKKQKAAKVIDAVKDDHESAALVEQLGTTLDRHLKAEMYARTKELIAHKERLQKANAVVGSAPLGSKEWQAADRESKRLADAYPAMLRRANDMEGMRAVATKKMLAAKQPSKIAVQHDHSSPIITRRVNDAAAWLAAITHGVDSPVKVVTGGTKGGNVGRAYYDSNSAEVNLHEHNDRAIAVHELGHHLEEQPGVREAVHAFLEHRLGDEPVQKLNDVTDGGFRDDEVGRKDDFEKVFGAHSAWYVGKKYDSGHTELLSMGVQALYEDPVGLAQKDPELCRFLIGVLHGRIRG